MAYHHLAATERLAIADFTRTALRTRMMADSRTHLAGGMQGVLLPRAGFAAREICFDEAPFAILELARQRRMQVRPSHVIVELALTATLVANT